ncbi:MAG: 16S rRNA (guanine(527)-N(7))-methyltransferase RsmG [Pelagibacteraceae bacterium]
MNENSVIRILINKYGFSSEKIDKLRLYEDLLLKSNYKYNLIGKSTINDIWFRHFLDSIQLVNLINFYDNRSVGDLGSGAGFPGMILALYNDNPKFHVKIYEKSPVKCDFLNEIREKCSINCDIIEGDLREYTINQSYLVCRAFKKLEYIIKISREMPKTVRNIIILKGKSAQEEVDKALKEIQFEYRLKKSITDHNSKIVIVKR